MTFRSILISLVCVLFLCGYGYLNDCILYLESVSNGHLLPIFIVGPMVLFVLLVNPLLRKIRHSLALTTAELVVIFTITTAAVAIPGRAMMEQFAQNLVLPYHWERITPGYHAHKMLSYYPKGTLVDPEPQDEVLNGFLMGTQAPKVPPKGFHAWLDLKLKNVPWKQWSTPVKTWMPLFFLSALAMSCLGLVLHHQWADRENLQYPIANFAEALLQQTPGQLYNTTFHNKLFWLGFAIVLLLRVNNGLYVWFPEEMIPVKLSHSLWPLTTRWPHLSRNPWNWGLMSLQIFPLVIAFAYFLNSEISFAMGISQILWGIFCVTIVGMGVNISTDYDLGGWHGWNRAGSYTAFALIMLYTGRHYYLSLTRKALWLDKLPFLKPLGSEFQDDASRRSANAMRLLLLSVTLLCLLAIRLGLSWPIAICTILLMLLTFVITARIAAETGLFFIQAGWQPVGAITALFGSYALGPTSIFICALLCSVLCIDQSQSLLPYLMNGLKLADKAKVPKASLVKANYILYAIGMLFALFVTLLLLYDYGTPAGMEWSFHRLPTMPIRAAEPAILQLSATGTMEASEALSGWQRILNIRPQPAFLWAAGIGFFGVILLSILRLRLPWWPLHPCFLLIWSTYPLSVLSHSFLLGWLIKKLVLRFGGNKLAIRLKPLAIGVITADILGAMIFMLVGVIYYFVTGDRPKTYHYFPR